MKRVCIVTAGHLSTCPRMVKAADALAENGYRVQVVSTSWVDWARAGDTALVHKRPGLWDWTVVDWNCATAPFKAYSSALHHRLARAIVRWFGAKRCSLNVLGQAHVRISAELIRATSQFRGDIYYGGGGALVATAVAARRARAPFAFDLEDFHSGEQGNSDDAKVSNQIAEQIERELLPAAAFLTAGSAAIADVYRERYGVAPVVLNNTFPLPAHSPEFVSPAGQYLKIYWFSQTIGPGRGLEDVVGAMGLVGLPGELHLRGMPAPGYVEELRSLGATRAPKLRIFVHSPAPPDQMIELARNYEVGLAVERPEPLNRQLCLTNKAFTYMLAGLAIVFTDTLGQRELALDLAEGALLYRSGDTEALAAGLKRWATDKAALATARRAAWERARQRWHWEHEQERGALLKTVGAALTKGNAHRCHR